MAQIARTEADKAAITSSNASNKVTELGKRPTDKAAEATRAAAGQLETVARNSFQSVRQAVEAGTEEGQKTARRAEAGMAEISQNLMGLLAEQAQHNVQVCQTLAQTTNWSKVAQVQSEFLRSSFQRAAQFTQRYLEINQAVMASGMANAHLRAKKA